MKLNEYTQELHKAIESLQQGNKSDAGLWLSNFYYAKGRSRQNNYVRILQWTLTDERYKQANPSIQRFIAKFYYFIDMSVKSEANTFFVKRTKDGYVIERKSLP